MSFVFMRQGLATMQPRQALNCQSSCDSLLVLKSALPITQLVISFGVLGTVYSDRFTEVKRKGFH